MKKFFLSSLLLLTLVSTGLFLWVRQGDGSLEYLIPLVEKALNPEESDYYTEMEEIHLNWDKFWTWPSLEIHQLTTKHRDLGKVLSIEKASAQIDLKAVIKKELQIRSIHLSKGEINTRFIPTNSSEPWTKKNLALLLSSHYQFVDSLLRKYHGLKYITMDDFSIQTEDPNKEPWVIGLNQVRVELDHSQYFKKMTFESTLKLGDEVTSIDIQVGKHDAQAPPDWHIGIKAFPSQEISRFIELPLGSEIDSHFDAEIVCNIQDSIFIHPLVEIRAKQGVIKYPHPFHKSFTFQSLILHSRWGDDFHRVSLKESSIELEGHKFQIDGDFSLDQSEGELTLQHPQLSLDWVLSIWPDSLLSNGKNWIHSQVNQSRFSHTHLVQKDDSTQVNVHFNSLAVHPWSQIPEVTSGKGSIHYSRHHNHSQSTHSKIWVELTQAKILHSHISQTMISLDSLENENSPHLFFKTRVNGSIKNALTILDQGILKKEDLPFQVQKGQHQSQLQFHLNLKDSSDFKNLPLQLQSEVKSTEIKLNNDEFKLGLISANNVQLNLSQEHLDIVGQGRAQGQLAEFKIQQNLMGRASLVMEIEARTNGEFLTKFYPNEMISGKIHAQMKLRIPKDNDLPKTIDIKANLNDTKIQLGGRLLKEPHHESSQLKAKLRLFDNHIEFPLINITGKKFHLAADGSFYKKNTRLEMNVRKFKANNQLLLNRTQLFSKGKFTSLKGRFINLYGFMELDTVSQTHANGNPTNDFSKIHDRIDLKFDRIQLSHQGYLKDTYMNSNWNHGELKDAKVKASFGNQKRLVAIMQKNAKTPTIKVQTQDAGEFLRTFEYYNHMFGGSLDLRILATKGFLTPEYRASYNIRNFRIAEAPTLSKIVALGSFVGIGDAFNGKGTRFHRARGVADIDMDRIKVYNTYIQGPSLSLYTTGEANTSQDKLKFEGNVIPFTSFNESLGLHFTVKDHNNLKEPDIQVKRLVSIHKDIKQELKKLESQP